MATMSVTDKVCVKCHCDLSHGKRMRDAQGHYWCLACGTEDSRRKHSTGQHCVDCRGKYDIEKMRLESGEWVCLGCIGLRERARAEALKAQSTAIDLPRKAPQWVVVVLSIAAMALSVLVLRMVLI